MMRIAKEDVVCIGFSTDCGRILWGFDVIDPMILVSSYYHKKEDSF